MRNTSRLMAALFAMQVMVAGFCMITAEAQAMPYQDISHAMDMGAHCDKSDSTDEHHQDSSDSCYHCDQPDEAVHSNIMSFMSVAMLLPGVISTPAHQQWLDVSSGQCLSRTPTGPPRSSSLLYSTSQRILI